MDIPPDMTMLILLRGLAWQRARALAAWALACWCALGIYPARAEEFLPPDQAFKFEARIGDTRTLVVHFDVAPGYYLYRERFAFEGLPVQTRLGTPILPAGHVKFDETFQKNVETYHDRLDVHIPVEAAPGEFILRVTSQGCADKGLCYPPRQHAVKVQVAAGALTSLVPISLDEVATWPAPPGDVQTLAAARPAEAAPVAADSTSALRSALQGGQVWQVAGVFLLAGLLLSFTPCVLPMLPILSSIIVGQGKHLSRGRGVMLSALYVLGMAAVYTALGVAAGLAGEGLAARLQQPPVLIGFAALLVALSLSMFGVYELRLPSAWQTRVSAGSARLPGGQALGVLFMGGLSALIVSPCVAAPLAGALLFISQTRDVWLGGTALFALALGMGVPLLLVGASAGRLLPRTGAWMDTVKQFFGLVLLGVAVWTVGPVLPIWAQMLAWATLLCLGAAWCWQALRQGAAAWAGRGLSGVLLLLAAAYVVGALSGGRDLLQPLGHWREGRTSVAADALPFQSIKGVEGLEAALAQADRPVMLDFYADWCVSCKEMERFTFTDPLVRQRLQKMILLRADVTANDAADRALLKRFGLFGPPGIVFFRPGGNEVPDTRVIGFQSAAEFVNVFDRVVP